MVFGCFAANAQALDLQVNNDLITVTAKPATEGDGYVVESQKQLANGVKPLCVSVSLTCGNGSTASACCPTSSYSTYCTPDASISCN